MSDIIEIESESITISEQCRTLVIVDQPSYDKAVNTRVAVRDFLKKVDSVFDPMKKKAHEAWQEVCKQQKNVRRPAEEALSLIDDGIRRFTAEQERKRREEETRLREEARRKEEEERLARAAELERLGADKESIDAILDAPIITEPVVAAPTFEKSAAVVMRDNWSAEVTDLFELVKAVAKDKSKIGLLQPNQTALNQMAKALKDTLSIPGVKAVNNKVVASGRGY